MKFNSAILALTFVFFCSLSMAQNFMPEFGQQWSKIAYVVKNDGSKVWGKAASGLIGPNGLMWINLKDTVTGEKTKYKIADIKELGISAKGQSKIGAVSSALSGTGSIKEAVKTDYKSMLKADYYLYRRVVDKKGKPRILQLLNPGFESRMQVYADPKEKNTAGAGITGGLVGGEAKTYYVTKGDSFGIYVRKGKYDKTMSSIFDDCPEMMKEFPKARFDNFSKHVFHYDSSCK